MRVLKLGFAGFLVSFIIALLLCQSVWLEMRVRVGMVIPLLVLLFLVSGLRMRLRVSYSLVLLLQGALLSILLLIYHFQWAALWLVPATLVREGLYLTNLSLRKANVVLMLILVLGNVAWVFPTDP